MKKLNKPNRHKVAENRWILNIRERFLNNSWQGWKSLPFHSSRNKNLHHFKLIFSNWERGLYNAPTWNRRNKAFCCCCVLTLKHPYKSYCHELYLVLWVKRQESYSLPNFLFTTTLSFFGCSLLITCKRIYFKLTYEVFSQQFPLHRVSNSDFLLSHIWLKPEDFY